METSKSPTNPIDPTPGSPRSPGTPANPTAASDHPYHPDATNDPLVGTQQHPDQVTEVLAEPVEEAATWPTAGKPEKSRILAGVLGILLGGLGVHRFYLAYQEVGYCQLAMFLASFGVVIAVGMNTGLSIRSMLVIAFGTAGLVYFWGAVEGIMILTGMLPHDGHGHPLR